MAGGPDEIFNLFVGGNPDDLDDLDTEGGPDDIVDPAVIFQSLLTQGLKNDRGTLPSEDLRHDGEGLRLQNRNDDIGDLEHIKPMKICQNTSAIAETNSCGLVSAAVFDRR